MVWHNLFIPHRETHKKAHLISWEAILIYGLIFLLLKISFLVFSFYKPGILGVESVISQNQLIELTNQERQKNGLSPLRENTALNQAAAAKATNMFQENYWAHFAPSGKTPWDFILSAGYKFTYAGENLAKSFSQSNEVVTAWMQSPTHRANILNPKYQDIGIAVVEGVLNGQKTTLVVQEFGTTQTLAAAPTVSVGGEKLTVPQDSYNQVTQLVAGLQDTKVEKALLDPLSVTKVTGLGILAFVAILVILDLLIIRKRGVLKVRSNHLAHLAVISMAAATLASSGGGSIL
ncbi:MAG: hypothetical protein HYW45_00785 [Candidatus Daviesbacteria bacterium]|nr:MAG: hypothetical protein HYW45_00785 [Candidatus Daviesbacteria bacterium]